MWHRLLSGHESESGLDDDALARELVLGGKPEKINNIFGCRVYLEWTEDVIANGVRARREINLNEIRAPVPN